jgi:hypothetical protein
MRMRGPAPTQNARIEITATGNYRHRIKEITAIEITAITQDTQKLPP